MKYFQKSSDSSGNFFQKSKGGNTFFHKKKDKKQRHPHSEINQQEDKAKPSPLERRHNPF